MQSSSVHQGPPQTNERLALAYGLGAVLLWSTVATGFKLGLAVMSVIQLLWLGTFVSWLVFAAYYLYQRQYAVTRPLLIHSMALGSLNPVLYYLVLFAAYDRLPAHIAQPLNYTWAITLALLAIPILGQQLRGPMIAGILISYAGVLLLLTGAEPASPDGLSWTGVTLALASTVLWALYWLLNTRWQDPPGTLMFLSFSWGLIALSVILMCTDGLPAFNPSNLMYGVWVGAIEMGVTFILWQSALRLTTQVGRISQLIFLSPFVSMLIINAVLNEEITTSAVLGLVVIVAGIAISQRTTA